ncbi:hypothetical protein LMG28614_05742 [Paraburkholderia ultramafica]|uniref:Uncharacterized protein n=1 Tax=Paraburkholderia ultramafica TaxID=1544867 RepID=A0A6S7D0V2_9BURK|nr:TIGR02391 family protein [Paraburkholderia ultramafica]CAB3803108.1 hypothetical protein LMG28614_05742 [Paraburkholderia ultramafica]
MRGAYETAAFEAMREVEIAVREAAGFGGSTHGVPMMKKESHPTSAHPTPRSFHICSNAGGLNLRRKTAILVSAHFACVKRN